MATTIRITRRTPFTKSDSLREDETLLAEAEALGDWLSGKDLALVTMNQVLAFAREEHADATLARDPVWYEQVWVREEQMWVIVCHDRGTVSFVPAGDSDPVQIRVEISATY